jgi:hypothetical protein
MILKIITLPLTRIEVRARLRTVLDHISCPTQLFKPILEIDLRQLPLYNCHSGLLVYVFF